MGIRGLTTYIRNRSHLYMDNYELHDTNVVIDGNAVAHNLYKWHCKSNDCFGGDYDKYASTITGFFQTLVECNVTPYIIFDGGYESRKVATVISRMKNKIKSAQQLNTLTEDSISVFPLFLREVFEDIVAKLNIRHARCDFEGDTEIANIARTLNCPVISYDSDFFVFDVLYIPFSTVETTARKKKKPKSKEMYSYIKCDVYRVEKFLNYYGGMDKSNLPVLAVLLGNDYVKRKQFSLFYNHLKMQKCHGGQSEQQKIIKSLIIWLQNETVESAIKKVLSRYKHARRKFISQRIQNAMRGYNYGDSEYLKYLGIFNAKVKKVVDINLDKIASEIDENEGEDEMEESEESGSDSEEENFSYEGVSLNKVVDSQQKVFKEYFRKCLFPTCFMDIMLRNTYYCVPQVENSSEQYSHAVSSEILSAIHEILTSSNNSHLICIGRNEHGHIKRYKLPHCDVDLPSFMEIQKMNSDERKKVILRILKINSDFIVNCLGLFPEDWHLFIIVLKYLSDKSVLTLPVICSLLLCKIILSYVDSKVGMYRSGKVFEKKFDTAINNILNDEKTSSINLKNTIRESLDDISYNDSLMCLKTIMPYFQIDIKMRTAYKLFDRSLVHSMAQFQSCFFHVKYLNKLLNLPYPNFIMSEFFNGTLIYNLTCNFMKRANLQGYLNVFLEKSPSVRNSLTLIINELLKYGFNNGPPIKAPRRKKKNKKPRDVAMESDKEESESEESVFDPNNKYSLLALS